MIIIAWYGSHCTLDFIRFCEEHKIIPFCLLLHTTHLLQPLDVVLFYSYKKELWDIPHKAMYNKVGFLHARQGMRQLAFCKLSIGSAFRKTGIVPFNLKIFSEGTVAIATSLKSAYKHLSSSVNAQHERAKRQSTSRKLVESSSRVMTVKDALRNIASNKAQE